MTAAALAPWAILGALYLALLFVMIDPPWDRPREDASGRTGRPPVPACTSPYPGVPGAARGRHRQPAADGWVPGAYGGRWWL